MKRQIAPLSVAENPHILEITAGFTGSTATFHAFKKVEEEIYRIPTSEYVPINIDLDAVLVQIMKLEPGLTPFRAQLEALPGFPIKYIDFLAYYVMAAVYISDHLRFTPPADDAGPALAAKLFERRDSFAADAKALVKRGFLFADALEKFNGTTGFRNIARDVMMYVELFRMNWSEIEHKTGLSMAELDEAFVEATKLLEAVARKEALDARRIALTTIRQATFTQVMIVWDHIRRGMTFLRWFNGDVDTYAPSLYIVRGGHKKEDAASTEGTTDGAAAATSTAASHGPSASGVASAVPGTTVVTTTTTSNPLIVPASTETTGASEAALPGTPPATPFGK